MDIYAVDVCYIPSKYQLYGETISVSKYNWSYQTRCITNNIHKFRPERNFKEPCVLVCCVHV